MKRHSRTRIATSLVLAVSSVFLFVGCYNTIKLHAHVQTIGHRESLSPRITETERQQQTPPTNHLLPDDKSLLPRVLVIVFPQYHSDPLNNELWGDGFTDWDNLRRAPLTNKLGFKIPRPTKELGYYDLTDVATRKKQGELAREHGVDGFVFHHYWFYDEERPGPSLHAPLTKMLKDGHPDVPFAFNWCNVKWMNTWHGTPREGYVMPKDGVLQHQYFPKDTEDPALKEHYKWLSQFFHHPNYIKVQGKPLLMLYQKKPGAYPVLKKMRELAIEDGFPGLYFVQSLTKPHKHLQQIKPPDSFTFQKTRRTRFDVFDKVLSYPNPSDWLDKYGHTIPEWCTDASIRKNTPLTERSRTVEISGIVTSFDNTPRRNFKDATVSPPDNPEKVLERFRKNVYASLYYEACCFPDESKENEMYGGDSKFVVINAWNEWAEGMAMEPSDVYGRHFLEIIRDTKNKILTEGC